MSTAYDKWLTVTMKSKWNDDNKNEVKTEASPYFVQPSTNPSSTPFC